MGRLARKKRCPSTGKKRYPSKVAAVTAAATLTRRRRFSSRPYYCRDCGHWHLTSMPMARGGRQW